MQEYREGRNVIAKLFLDRRFLEARQNVGKDFF